jgi:hypothetical protein
LIEVMKNPPKSMRHTPRVCLGACPCFGLRVVARNDSKGVQ